MVEIRLIFDKEKMTLKIRTALFLTFKTQKNARPRIFFMHTKLELGLSLFIPELSSPEFNYGHAIVCSGIIIMTIFSGSHHENKYLL